VINYCPPQPPEKGKERGKKKSLHYFLPYGAKGGKEKKGKGRRPATPSKLQQPHTSTSPRNTAERGGGGKGKGGGALTSLETLLFLYIVFLSQREATALTWRKQREERRGKKGGEKLPEVTIWVTMPLSKCSHDQYPGEKKKKGMSQGDIETRTGRLRRRKVKKGDPSPNTLCQRLPGEWIKEGRKK